jgi:hypothetical protein
VTTRWVGHLFGEGCKTADLSDTFFKAMCLVGDVMAGTQQTDQVRLIDQTLSLFQNAIAETKTILPPVRLGRAAEPKDVAPSEPPAQEKQAASLIDQAVSFVRAVAGFVPKATETASPSLQPPDAEEAREKPVGDARSDPIVDQALLMAAIVSIDEPKAAEAASPPSLKTAEAAVLSLPPPKPTSKDVLPLKRPAQEEPPSLIGHALSLVNKVAISEHKAILVEEIVISEHKAAAAPHTAAAAVLSLRQSVDEPPSKDVLPLGRSTLEKPPFLTGHALSFVNEVTISEHKAILVDEIVISEHKGGETASPSVQLSVAEQSQEKPVGDARSDPLIDRALSMVAIGPIDEPKAVEAASPASLNTPEAAVLSLRQTVDKPASTDVPPLELPAQEEPPSQIGHALSLINNATISEHKPARTASASLQPPRAEQARGKPVGDARSDPKVDQALSMSAIVTGDEPKEVKSALPPLFKTAEAGLLALRPPIDKQASKDALNLERLTQEEPLSFISHTHPTAVEETLAALSTETLSRQPLMKQFSPKERLDMDRADILRRVAIFKEHQQRFQREREEYYATTMAKMQARK